MQSNWWGGGGMFYEVLTHEQGQDIWNDVCLGERECESGWREPLCGGQGCPFWSQPNHGAAAQGKGSQMLKATWGTGGAVSEPGNSLLK